MTVLITGAAGRIGSRLMADLPACGWEVRGFDRVGGDGIIPGDITSPTDLDNAMAGISQVVHLAAMRVTTPWAHAWRTNVNGAVEVFEAARRHGVERVIYASSNHATGFTRVTTTLPADLPARPDTIYGVAKAFGEILGRYYADRYGLRVACLRIGSYGDEPQDHRELGTWLSPADCARLVDACLRSEGLSYSVVWGVSANTRNQWSQEEGRALGYHPQDDAESYAEGIPIGRDDYSDYVGGYFLTPAFDDDELARRWPEALS